MRAEGGNDLGRSGSSKKERLVHDPTRPPRVLEKKGGARKSSCGPDTPRCRENEKSTKRLHTERSTYVLKEQKEQEWLGEGKTTRGVRRKKEEAHETEEEHSRENAERMEASGSRSDLIT